ncbi:MAG TPA: 30S ribosomal protein S9 [Candidatus Nanoarchaeia archaeon]|nr:30S ribosomal protein S9 [Candidatus Nanoarchaeia archaeon]
MKIVTSGKRKRAIAKAAITEGTGNVKINKKDHKSLNLFERLRIEEPLRIAESILGKKNFDVIITVKGGGEQGQIDASRIALAKAIVSFSKSKDLARAYAMYDRNLLIADVRRKEACKPGDSKARAKRQTSYR